MEVTLAFRPVSMRDWFIIDPKVHDVDAENNLVGGVQAEIVEAVTTSEGHVIWRISGAAQKAECAVDLEVGRQEGSDCVTLGTLQVNPLTLESIPKRIITRSVIEMQPSLFVKMPRIPKKLDTDTVQGLIDKSKKTNGSALQNILKSNEQNDPHEDSTEVKTSSRGDTEDYQTDNSQIEEAINSTQDRQTPIRTSSETADDGIENRDREHRSGGEQNSRRRSRSDESDDERRDRKRKLRMKILKSEQKMLMNSVNQDESANPALKQIQQNLVAQRRPVDSECEDLKDRAHIYEENGDVYDIMLNQTNVQYNNNKFYLLQLAKSNDHDQYYVWFRWGRVGKTGQTHLTPCSSNLTKAKEIFQKKFYDKTLNEFSQRDKFEKVDRKYAIVQITTEEIDSKASSLPTF